MVKQLIRIIFLTLVLGYFTAQSHSQDQNEKISLTMVIGDFALIRAEFDEIEVKAEEIEALLAIQNSMDRILTSPVVLEKSQHETLTVDIIKAMANNMYLFMDRMMVKGSDAKKFQRFRNNLKTALFDSK